MTKRNAQFVIFFDRHIHEILPLMRNAPHSNAWDRVVEAAEAAQGELAASGSRFAPLDVIRIAPDYVARQAVFSGEFGVDDARVSLAEQLRKEFLTCLAYWEEVWFKGGEVVVVSTNPMRTMRRIELVDLMLDEKAAQAKAKKRRPRA
ncbi:hypothetical protein [uncultured Novosphingobium sp.]|uniref:hypothetical protein n=1 Tax=uncultured Novosphingobium sp. TaxID=292277 RepID=UPI0025919AAC|nr:hypothetical protein [uncultured Novosphingobium sp.]